MMHVTLRDGYSGFWPVRPQPVEIRRQRGSLPSKGSAAESKWLRELLRAREARGKFFNPRLFADPAWDMLIELYAAELAQRRVSVSSLSLASGVPATTALRWIGALQKDGLVIRHADPFDGRRVFLELSPKGSQAIRDYFASLPASLYPFDD